MSAPYENGTQETGAELAALWARTLERLAGQSEVTPQFQAWLSLTRPIALVEDTAVLAAPHEFAKDVLESRLRPALTAALAAEIGRDVRVAVTVEALTSEPASAESDVASTDRRSDSAHGGSDAGMNGGSGIHDDIHDSNGHSGNGMTRAGESPRTRSEDTPRDRDRDRMTGLASPAATRTSRHARTWARVASSGVGAKSSPPG